MSNSIRFRLTLCLTLYALCALGAQAQAQLELLRRAPAVTASATAEQVRFVALPAVYQMRLEVFAVYGATVFDSDFKSGNLLDWGLRDQLGLPLADGSYLCVVTVKDFAGRRSQQRGAVLLQAGQASLLKPEQAEPSIRELNARMLGDITEPLVILPGGAGLASTMLAHDGNSGQLVSGSGGLSFRTGDFFAGKDVEQMRLTPEGNLGLGVKQPQARLDVGGLIRTSEGLVFPDGTVQTTAYIASGRSLSERSERSGLQRDAADRRLTELSEPAQKQSAGGLGPPVKTDIPDDLVVNGNLIFTPAPARDITMQNNNTGLRFYGAPMLTNSPAAAAIQFWGNNNQQFPGQLFLDAGAHNSGALIFRTAPTGGIIAERMRVTATGNVGIGTMAPAASLEISRSVAVTDLLITKASTLPSIVGRRSQGTLTNPTATTTGNILLSLVGRGHTGTAFNGDRVRIDMTASENWTDTANGTRIVFATTANGSTNPMERMRIDHNGQVGIGTTAPERKLHVGGSTVFPLILAANSDPDGTGVHGWLTNTGVGYGAGVLGESYASGGKGVYGYATGEAGFGVYGYATSTTGNNTGVFGTTPSNTNGATGVYGSATGSGNYNHGIYGKSDSGFGTGVLGKVTSTNPNATGVWGIAEAPALAGYFSGNVGVSGTLTAGVKPFKIDHPLDPENKYLYHVAIESPDMKNLYDGNVTTDADGKAEVTLPAWFGALNRDFRYQLTVIGQFAQAIVAEKIKDNRFKIKTSLPNVEVSWQVTGIRQDAFANQHRVPVEEDKPENERGSYLHPAAFGKQEDMGVIWKLRPEALKQFKAEREKTRRRAAGEPVEEKEKP
jgi:hypothetical protein